MTPAQLQALKNAIVADPVLNAFPNNPDGNTAIQEAFKAIVTPTHWVWRTRVTRAEIYHKSSPTGSIWNWTTYKNQAVAEQGAWTQMFMGDAADFSLPNLRAGVGAIFTGSAQANAQRDHVLAHGRRPANRLEKLFAVGTGTDADPALMAIEGEVSIQDIETARNLP